MLSLCAIFAMLAQAGAPVPNLSRQAPLLVAEEVFPAIVMSVEDGDSVVLKTSGEQLTVDLAGVDAPELSQPGGPQAKQFLTSLTLGKTVTVRLTSVADRLARLELGGVDVTAALIRAGMGWHCPRYADESDLAKAEAEARNAKRGLWSVSRPTPPWLSRGAGACWQQTTKPRVSSQKQPNFSGTWTAVSPSALIVEERRWTAPGEEATNVRHVLWMDDRGQLNFEVSSPQPIGQSDATTLVLQRDGVPQPARNAAPGGR